MAASSSAASSSSSPAASSSAGPVFIDAPRFGDTPSLESLVSAIEREDRSVDLAGAVIRSGWENVVVETTDGLIVRFPRPGVDFEREMAILRRLHVRLPADPSRAASGPSRTASGPSRTASDSSRIASGPQWTVQIPKVEWTGRFTACAAYRKITGAAFDLAAYNSASTAQRDALAGSLATFLARMHSCLTAADIEELRIPAPDPSLAVTAVTEQLDRIPTAARPAVEDLLSAVVTLPPDAIASGPPVVLHNDFNTSNLVLDAPAGGLTGVWDFSCVQLGEPVLDLRYFEGDSIDLLCRIADAYGHLTNRLLNPRVAILANRLEEVSDHLELDEPERLVETVRRWDTVNHTLNRCDNTPDQPERAAQKRLSPAGSHG